MNSDFERYHCQMALPQFGEKSQRLLQQAKVLIAGAGGLGCPAAQYLAAAGVGTLAIADDDVISIRNLHRQILFYQQDAGAKKVKTACQRLQEQNPLIRILSYDLRITSQNVTELISSFDLVIEGTDNFETKCLLNDACVLAKKPLVYGAIYQYEGQMAILNVLQNDGTYSPHYRDIFPDADKMFVPDCAEGGVMPALAGIVGCMQANEAIKYITGDKNLMTGKLWIFNAQSGEARTIDLGVSSRVQITRLPESVPTIRWEELESRLFRTGYELIDVRTEEEHRLFNIGGKNIPLHDLGTFTEEKWLSGPVVFYCSTGKRSAVAARRMKAKFPNAELYSLKGGIHGITF